MTAHTDVPIPLVPGGGRRLALDAVSVRMLATGRRLLIDGFALLGFAIVLGIAETIALWFGAVVVALGLLVVGALIVVAGIACRVGARSHH